MMNKNKDNLKTIIRESITQAMSMLKTEDMQILGEASFSRLLQNYEDIGFIVISAERGERTPQENTAETARLKAAINTAGYGYIPSMGGYIETDVETGDQVRVAGEQSFIVPNGPYGGRREGFDPDALFSHAKNWAKRFEQESFLFVPPGGPARFVDENGNTLQFGPTAAMSGIVFDDSTQPFFSSFQKGSQRERPFSYVSTQADVDAESAEEETSGIVAAGRYVRGCVFLNRPPSKGGGLNEARSRAGEIFVQAENYNRLSRAIDEFSKMYLGKVRIASVGEAHNPSRIVVETGDEEAQASLPEMFEGFPVDVKYVDPILPQRAEPIDQYLDKEFDVPTTYIGTWGHKQKP